MRITTNGTTISGSLSEVLATLTHIGFKASDTTAEVTANDTAKSVTMGQVAGITVTPDEAKAVAKALVAKLGAEVTPEPVPVPKPARDSVIKQAISDVEDLLSRDYYKGRGEVGAIVANHVGASVDFVIGTQSDRIDFFVNADKKTVIAKLFINDPGYSDLEDKAYATQGRAKCAPGDVFNEHIGKAIALRRALGLEVPVEYFTVEARDRDDLAVGDVVRGDQVGFYDYVTQITELIGNPDVYEASGQAFTHTEENGWLASSQVTLINDSARHTAPDLEVSRIIRH